MKNEQNAFSQEIIREISQITAGKLQELRKLVEEHTEIIILGNGGSNAIASHMAQDYTKVLKKRAIAFDSASRLTCYWNDYDQLVYQKFIEQMMEYSPTGHTLVILISSSGNSRNILEAANYCKDKVIDYVMLTGFEKDNHMRRAFMVGSKLDFHVDSSCYGVVECVHHVILHSVVGYRNA